MPKHAPQPSSRDGFDDQIRYFDQAVLELGPIIRFPMGHEMTGMLVATATGADRILRTAAEGYPKGPLWEAVGRITGNGLSTNQDIASWRRQRLLMNAAFSRTSVERYVQQIQSVLSSTVGGWTTVGQQTGLVNITTMVAELTQTMRLIHGPQVDHVAHPLSCGDA